MTNSASMAQSRGRDTYKEGDRGWSSTGFASSERRRRRQRQSRLSRTDLARCPAAVKAVVENGDRESEEEEEDIFAPRPYKELRTVPLSTRGSMGQQANDGDGSDREREDEDEAALLAHLATEVQKACSNSQRLFGSKRDGAIHRHAREWCSRQGGGCGWLLACSLLCDATPRSDKLAALSSIARTRASVSSMPSRPLPLSPQENTSHSTAIGHHQSWRSSGTLTSWDLSL